LPKKQPRQASYFSKELILNFTISVAGILLLGFIYSFSKNASHGGIPIDVVFPELDQEPRLAVEVYQQNPVKNIKVEVLNGCGIKGIAAKASDFLRLQQVDVIRSDNADKYDYPNTTIIGRNENFESLKIVAESLGLSVENKTNIKHDPDETLGVDVTVILGKDIADFTELFDFISNL
jgi:hypothetical protein|tara:strand:- start:81 stop:614 length:534 start_codon:yes stop_codon:yes gene_type:complete